MGTYGRNRGSVLLNSHRICERRRGSWRQSSLVRAVRRRRLELTHRRVDGLTGERRWPRGRRGRGTRNSGARASGIGRRPLLALRLARVLVDDFHRIRYPTLPAPNAALCMPGCPPRHACVAERRSLLTYLLTDQPLPHETLPRSGRVILAKGSVESTHKILVKKVSFLRLSYAAAVAPLGRLCAGPTTAGLRRAAASPACLRHRRASSRTLEAPHRACC